jgi:polyhydroxyalkanoate synthesis regulator phasin
MNQDRVDEAAFGTSGAESATTRAALPPRAPMTPQYAFLASIGAVATALDEAEAYYDRFVERGRRLQDEWRTRAGDMQVPATGARYRLRDAMRTAMDAFLDTMNVPNKGDVDTINVKLNILTRKIDDLQVQSGGSGVSGGVTPPPPATTDIAT